MKSTYVDGLTMGHLYLRRIEVSGPEKFITYKRDGQWHSKTWNEFHAQVLGLFSFLDSQGLKAGDKVCISSNSRPEWLATDIANIVSGFSTVPIYQSSSVDDTAFIMKDSGCKFIFVEDEKQAIKVIAAQKLNGTHIPMVSYEPVPETEPGYTITPYSKASTNPAANASEKMKAAVQKLTPDMMASIVYTSGTTGRPKGAVLTHANFLGELRSILSEIDFRSDDMTLSFLPFAHILGRCESLLPAAAGIQMSFAENVNVVAQNIQELKPTILFSVPRIYEKIYTRIQSEVENSPEAKKKIFKWAITLGRQVATLREQKKSVPLKLLVPFKLADKVVLSKIRQKLGGRIRFNVSGGAPLSRELCEIFYACGIQILEGYGLTETTAAITVNRPTNYRFGTVGIPLPGAEIRIAEDGEVQVKGHHVFKEYHNNKEATAEVFTKDGYFCTGDIGEITTEGFLKITDRKKELIVTSGGKKIAPQKLENMLKTCRFISNGMVYGDKQKYLVAVIALNEAEIKLWGKDKGITAAMSCSDLSKSEPVIELINDKVKEINSTLASFETIKKVYLAPADFTVETGEITPSLKLKRKFVTEKFKNEIASLY